jgi:hypothetical protein
VSDEWLFYLLVSASLTCAIIGHLRDDTGWFVVGACLAAGAVGVMLTAV